jgi:transcriptional regulator with XRE-family HTH domain
MNTFINIPMLPSNPSLNQLFEDIGSRLYQTRHARNEKLTTVARSVGVSHTVVSQIENGRYKSLSLQLLYRIIDYYDLPLTAVLLP